MSHSATVLQKVLAATKADIGDAAYEARQLRYAIYFGKHFGAVIREAFVEDFGADNMASGEVPAAASDGSKRVDVSYSTRHGGLGFMVSLKSVHAGEKKSDGTLRFTHNLKRNDEELRVEATALHVRQPYSVLVAVVILPLAACDNSWRTTKNSPLTSSFARWVQKLWTLQGRTEPEDPPNQFELVFIALYDPSGSEFGFYQVGGAVPCPRHGRPSQLLEFSEFIDCIKVAYRKRNQRTFQFEGEGERQPIADPVAEEAGE